MDGQGLVGDAGQIADGKVDDRSGVVTEAWTGPQVAWKMARGDDGRVRRQDDQRARVWLAFCALFLIGLADFRRPLSLRNLDLLALLSFSVSLWFFNDGDIFTSVPLAYPPLVYLLARMIWIGVRGRRRRPRAAVWPVWLLVAATVFLAGFRVGLNVETSNVIDVGYAGVIGARPDRRRRDRRTATCPSQGNLRRAARPTPTARSASASRRTGAARRRTTAATRTARSSYLAYVPGYLALRLDRQVGRPSGRALHVDRSSTSSACSASRSSAGASAGRGSPRRSPFAWAAYPFTQYASSSNTNDAILPALLDLGLLLRASPPARGALRGARRAGRSSRALLVAPLWATYPNGLAAPRGRALRRRLPRRDVARVLGAAARAGPARMPRACSGIARSAGSSAASRRSRSGTGGSTTRAGSRTCTSSHQLREGARCSPARSPSRSFRAGSRRCSSPR